MRSVLGDLRHGLRLLARSPLFTCIASLSLALGIGANTAIFTVVNALLLTPLPVRDPSQIVALFTSDFSGPPHGGSSYADVLDFARAPSLSGVAASRVEALSLRADRETERVFAEIVNPSYFDVLGVGAARGRVFGGPDKSPDGDGRASADSTAIVLSHRFWTRRFAADPQIVGRTLVLNGQALTVAGVANASFGGLLRGLAVDLWVPMTAQPLLFPQSAMTESRSSRNSMAVARLASNATLARARSELDTIAAGLQADHPREWTDVNGKRRRVTVLSEDAARLPPQAMGPATAFLGVLFAIVAMVLLVACANVAGLLVGRAASRRREMAVRLALGAGRARLVRQLLTESLVLALVGGTLGLLVAQWTLSLLSSLQPPVPFPLALDFSLDGRVLVFASLVSLASGTLFGLAPALQATRVALLPALRNDVLTWARGSRIALRDVLVVGQVALSLLLLVVGGLFLRGVQRAHDIDMGFETRHVLTATVDPSMLGYSEERTGRVYDQLLERVRALPGIDAAAVARVVPLSFSTGRRRMRPEGYRPRPGEDLEEPFNQITSGYFSTMGMRLVRGRDFTDADRAGSEPVAIVNEAFVQRYWPGQDALQKRVSASGDTGPWLRVVGVVANAKYFSLAESPRATWYLPFLQHRTAEATLLVKGRGAAAQLAAPVRAAVRAVDPGLPILTLATLEEQTSLSLLPQQVAIRLLGSFGVLALLMAGIGLYGVLAHAVLQRTREIGIRVALGATRRDVLGLVLGQGVRLTGVGVVLGLLAAGAATRLLVSFLYGVSPLDPLAYAGGLAVLLLSTGLAVWLPARRATRVDPVVALRYE